MPLRDQYWRDTPLSEMSHAEWEALCDGCGLCCLHKLEDADTAEISYTNVACRLLDCTSCRCSNYPHRKQLVPDCVVLRPDMVAEFPWLPKSCGYRRVAEGRDLAPWHPLVSGSPDTVHEAGISGRGRVISERDSGPLEEHIVHWEDDDGAAT